MGIGEPLEKVFFPDKPDAYLAQDAENQFEAIYFVKGGYNNMAIVVGKISSIEPVKRSVYPNDGIEYFEFIISKDDGLRVPVRFGIEKEAIDERVKVLMQIEKFYGGRNEY